MRIRLFALLLVCLLLGGCARAQTRGEMARPIDFYECAADGTADYGSAGGALRPVTVDLGRQTVTPQEVLNRYLRWSGGAEYVSPFPEELEGTALLRNNGILELRFNSAFSALSGASLTLAAAGLTLTLTQLDGVDGLRISANGAILSAQWPDVFTPESFLLADTSAENPEYAVQLYFLDAERHLTAQRRMIACGDRSLLPEMAVNALLAGPAGHSVVQAVPAGTTLLDCTVEDRLCTVVFSEEFTACDTDADSAEAAVHAVVLTLCSLETVEQVQLQILGGATLQYCAIDAPLSPGSNWTN